MTVSHGQDPERVDAVGEALGVLAERVDGVSQTGRAGVVVLADAWDGPDAERFAGEWSGAESALASAAQVLRETGRIARTQAADQRSTSEGGGGGGAGVPLGAGSGGRAGGGSAGVPMGAGSGGRAGGAFPRAVVVDPVEPAESVEDLEIPYPDIDEGKWTPQGSATTADGKYVLTAFYDGTKEENSEGKEVAVNDHGILAIQPTDGGPVRYVRLDDNSHYGGLAIDGENVYVSGNGEHGVDDGSQVHRYTLDQLMASSTTDLSEVDSHGDLTEIEAQDTAQIETGSTITAHDGNLYAARYVNENDYEDDLDAGKDPSPPMVYEYQLNDDGSLPSDWTPTDEFDAPFGLQGLATDDGENFYFTQSQGASNPSNLVLVNSESGQMDVVRDDLSPLSQGLSFRNGELVIGNESAAEPYVDEVEGSDSPWLPNFAENPVEPDDTYQEIDPPEAPDYRLPELGGWG